MRRNEVLTHLPGHSPRTAVAEDGFGVLHVHDLRGTLATKGFLLHHDVRALDVCNPRQARGGSRKVRAIVVDAAR